MSGVLDSRRVAEYRKKISDPLYLTHALVQVAGMLMEMLAAPERSEFRAPQNGHRSCRSTSHFN